MTGSVRLRDLLAAEVIKVGTLPVAWIAPMAALAAETLLSLAAATDAVRVAGSDGEVAIAQLGTVLLAPAYVLLALPVLVAGSEYGGGRLRVSLAAVPDRHRFFAVKLLATAAMTALAAVAVMLAGQLAGPGGGGGFPARVTAGLLLGLIGFGFAVVARTAVTPLAVLVLLPLLVSTTLGGILPGFVRLLPHEAMLSFLGMPAGPGLALGRPAGLLVTVAWAALGVAAAWVATVRRDG